MKWLRAGRGCLIDGVELDGKVMGQRLVMPSRCAAKASFDTNIQDTLERCMGGAARLFGWSGRLGERRLVRHRRRG